MTSFDIIQDKLHSFIRKYYTNELIKGVILFMAFGLLYFLLTLLIEYFLWLSPLPRTILFWIFVIGEGLLFFRYIVFPIFKLIGFANGISLEEASIIIGRHFSEVDDKLLNMLQLSKSHADSELVLASIEQKALTLKPFPFVNAIHFTTNLQYVKYLLIPIVLYFLLFLTGRISLFTDSYTRIVHHQQVFTPPAPFEFFINHEDLQVIEGSSFTLQVKIRGDIIPEQAKIIFNSEYYFLQHSSIDTFTYHFENLKKPVSFVIEANTIRSKPYTISIIPIPKIQHITLKLDYPSYLHKKNEVLTNTGNVVVPAGTKIVWEVRTLDTDSLFFTSDNNHLSFKREDRFFKLQKRFLHDVAYSISSSNRHLSNYEKLDFLIQVLDDAYPKMDITTDIDSISRGPAHFFGKLSDDHGLSKLELLFFDQAKPSVVTPLSLDIPKQKLASFFYTFPEQLTLIKGHNYSFYFKLYDNDRITGPKFVKSATYSYHLDTDLEREEKLLAEEKKNIDILSKQLRKHQQKQHNLQNISTTLKNNPSIDYPTGQRIQQYLNQQLDFQQNIQQKTQQLIHQLTDEPEIKDSALSITKKDLLERIKETQALLKEKKLLEELQKLAEKLDKDNLLDKLDKLSTQSRQKEKSLEQLLELTKRFYVEQKATQISQKLSDLAKKQDSLSHSSDNSQQRQDSLHNQFKDISKEIEQFKKDNEALKEPMPVSIPKADEQSISQDMDAASKQLSQNQKPSAQKSQQSAASKLKKMAAGLQAQLQAAQGEMIQEDIALLRIIIANLLTFSFKQEDLMLHMDDQALQSPNFAKLLKKQQVLKTYFEHIDDSLYVLSLRQPKLSSSINTYLADAHYYLSSALSHYADNQFIKANSDQHYVMKASNDLALLLSRLLDNMQSSLGKGKGQGQGMGKGQGSSGSSFSLPDIIKQQGELAKDNGPQGKSQGSKGDGKSSKGSEGTSSSQGNTGKDGSSNAGEIYSIYQQQARLRQALEKQLASMNSTSLKKKTGLVITEMEALEKRILEYGITNDVVQRMKKLQYKLLQLKQAKEQQEQEKQRISKPISTTIPKLSPKALTLYKSYIKETELLQKQPIPFTSIFQKRINDYFNSHTP